MGLWRELNEGWTRGLELVGSEADAFLGHWGLDSETVWISAQ